jgi:hypothetical protein
MYFSIGGESTPDAQPYPFIVALFSALVGIAIMGVLLTIPGLVTKYSHSIQVVRMKKASSWL